MNFWQGVKERVRRRQARRQERRQLFRRAIMALHQMGTLEAQREEVDLVVLRVGVAVLEANAQVGPVFLVPVQQICSGGCEGAKAGEVVH